MRFKGSLSSWSSALSGVAACRPISFSLVSIPDLWCWGCCAKTPELLWVGAARPVRSDSLFLGAGTVCIFARRSAVSPYSCPLWSNLMGQGYQMFQMSCTSRGDPSKQIHMIPCGILWEEEWHSPTCRSSAVGRYLRAERLLTKILNCMY